MELSVQIYLFLILAVAAGRVVELRRSRSNQRGLAAAGSAKSAEPGYVWMVALHSAMLVCAPLEVLWGQRPWLPALGIPSMLLFGAANLTRWWVIHTLGPRWNVQVMSASLGVVSDGPYKWVRHPNYTAVFGEMLALPLIHTAWVTAVVGTLCHVLVLRRRVVLEESVLMQHPGWRAAFADRPRFLP
jgi:methyltransferase